MNMAYFLKRNKFFTIIIAAAIILGSLTFSNLPGAESQKGIQTINGVTFNFADYPSLNDEQIALYNYMSKIIMDEPVNSFDNWNAKGFESFLHYMLAFTDYSITSLFETTPGYRTNYYQEPAHRLIKKMDTSMKQYGNESIEYLEWGRTTFPEYYWPNPLNKLGLYMGGFRGPANIMWTGHFTLMQSYYERCFNTREFVPVIRWFINDWKNSLTTDGYGNEKCGGIWG